MTVPEISVDFSAGPFAAPSTWTDLSDRARRLSLHRGRSHELDLSQAGRLDALLDDRDRALDPDNSGGTYAPNVTPMKHVRARVALGGTTYPLYSGFVEDWGQSWPGGTVDAVVPLQAADAFKLLNLAKVAGTRYGHQLYTDLVDVAVAGANAAHYYLDEASGTVFNDRLAGNFDLNGDTNVTAGAAVRPPTWGRPYSVSFGTADSAGNGLSRTTGPGFDNTSPETFAWAVWLKMSAFATDGYVMGIRATTDIAENALVIWKMDSTGTGIVIFNGASSVWTSSASKASFFLADGAWHHYAIRVTLKQAGVGVEAILASFYRDGAAVGSAVSGNAAGNFSRVPNVVNLMFAGGDGGLGGNHGIAANMAQLLFINNNAPSVAELEELGTQVFDYIPQGRAGLQITSILDGIGWSSGLRAIDTGTKDMIGIRFAAGDKVLDTLLAIAETSERGLLFADGGGTLTFWDADTLAARVSQGTFGDTASEIQYAALQTRHDDADIYNQIAVTYNDGGGTVYVEDGTSINTYGPRLLSRALSLAGSADAATAAADALAAYKDPHTRPVQLELVSSSGTAKLAQMFARKPGDRITVLRRPPGGGTVTLDSIIEGVALETDTSGAWKATWDLAPADGVNLLTAQQSGFELGMAGWDTTGDNSTSARSTALAYEGVASLAQTTTTGGAGPAYSYIALASAPAVTAGRRYRGFAWLRAAATARNITAHIHWYTSGGALISTSDGAATADTTTGWTQVTVSAVAPATAAKGLLSISTAGGASSEVHYIDVVAFYET